MIGVPSEDLLGAVELLGEKAARQHMGPSHPTQREHEIGGGLDLGIETLRAADQEDELLRSGRAPGREAAGEPGGIEGLAAFVESDDERGAGVFLSPPPQMAQQQLSFAAYQGETGQRSLFFHLYQVKQWPQTAAIFFEQVLRRAGPRLADRKQNESHYCNRMLKSAPMLLSTPTRLPQRIAIFVVPKFSMMGFACAIEPLRSANRMSGRELYSWHILSKDGKPVTASNGIPVVPEAALADAARYDVLIVSAGIDGHLFHDKEVFAQLRRLARRGMDIGALTLGSYLLARAGLLDGYRCTVHWENLSGFMEAFPKIEVTSELFEIDRDRFTCSGGIAAFDLMLHVIVAQHGFALASAVSDQFIHERIRDKRDRQRMALPARFGIRHPKLLAAIRRMEENLEEPVSRADLARTVKVSSRQLERLFRKYLGRTPTRFYLDLRLDKARQLLQQTDMTVLDVALACGFVSASHFSKCYRERFLRTPRGERQPPL
jgi:AraC family transcriptional regulator, glycine betaine-responsive activator